VFLTISFTATPPALRTVPRAQWAFRYLLNALTLENVGATEIMYVQTKKKRA
jgi:hypothetical protein